MNGLLTVAVLLSAMQAEPCLDCVVAGDPRGKGRPRFNRVQGRAYTDAATETWEKRAATAFRSAWGRQPSIGANEAVLVQIEAFAKRPQRLKKAGPWLPTAKPDVDNIAKIVMDGLGRGIGGKRGGVSLLPGVLEDDKSVVAVLATKVYADVDAEPCVRVRMWRLLGG